MRITVRGNTLLLRPWSQQLVPSCSYSQRDKQRGPGAKQGYKYTRQNLFVEEIGHDGVKTALVHSGLLPRILRACKRYKIDAELDDRREPIPEALLSQVQPLREFQPESLAAVIHSYFGIINCPTGSGKSFLIKQICRVYPHLKILVTTRSAEVRGRLHDDLADNCKQSVSELGGSKRLRLDSDIIVATDKSLHKIPGDWPDLVLYDEVHRSGSLAVANELGRFSTARRFGFSASPEGRGNNSDRLVEALFGPSIIEVDYKSAEKAGIVSPIEVRLVNVASRRQFKFKSNVALERHGYWRHVARNKKIAEVANAFPPDAQTLIMVKTAEHVLHLHRLLPHFKIVHRGIDNTKWKQFLEMGIVADQDEHLREVDVESMRKSFEANDLKKVICTPVWNEGVDFTHLKVLIRGDGQTSPIECTQIPGRLSRIGHKPVGILVDFIDHFGDWYLHRSHNRRAQYHGKGWYLVDNWDPSW